MPGISAENITVNLDRDAFTVGYDPAVVSLDAMYEAIRQLGYTPGLQAPDNSDQPAAEGSGTSPVDVALSAALSTNRLVLLDFSASWCAACQLLDTQVLANSSVVEALQDYVFVEVDTDRYSEVAKAYDVVGMPTLIVLNPQGEEIYRNVGLIAPAELERLLVELSSN